LVYIYYPKIWQKAKLAEEVIGYSILKDTYLGDLEKMFEQMKELKILPTEHIQSQRYWADVKTKMKNINNSQFDLFTCEMNMPCDCSF